ncbi:MAG: hypothetical protein ACFFAS_05855 [Promethearchaeota archaeon]
MLTSILIDLLKNKIHKVEMLARSTIEFVKQKNQFRLNAINLSDFFKNRYGVIINTTYI